MKPTKQTLLFFKTSEKTMKKLGMIAAAAAMTAGTLSADIQINKYLSVGGFVDFTYQNVDVSEPAGVTGLDTSDFTMDQAEIDFKLDFGGGLTGQIDLNALAESTNSLNTSVEQAYLNYDWGNFDLTVGKFATFIGLEGLEPVDLYQYSNSLSFSIEPTYHTGLCGNYENGIFNAALAIVNSLFDNNVDSNDELAFAVHLGIKPNEAWSFNANYATGEEGSNSANFATVGTNGTSLSIPVNVPNSVPSGSDIDADLFTIDASWSNYGWTLGAEYASLDLENAAGVTLETDAWMFMANYAFTEQFALTGRYSTAEGKTGGDLSEISISPSYAFTPNWLGLVEYRKESGSATYAGAAAGFGLGTADADIITLETILSF